MEDVEIEGYTNFENFSFEKRVISCPEVPPLKKWGKGGFRRRQETDTNRTNEI